MSLNQIIADKRIAITIGPGGVGKTSVAAAIGLQAAVVGRQCLVLTLDPAQRLAQALGLDDLKPGAFRQLSRDELIKAGVPAEQPLTVAMLDTQQAWTNLIHREVSDPGLRQAVLGHPFFKRMSMDLAGSHEYAAMEEIHHLYRHKGYDLLVLDTPPTVQGVDFLDAPERILQVLDTESYRWLLRPTLLASRLGLRALDFSGGYVARIVSRFTGLDFLRELAAFVELMSDLLEGFRRRATTVKATLRSSVTGYVLVTTADPRLGSESRYLFRRLQHRDLSPQAVVVNRVTPDPGDLPEDTDWRQQLLDACGQDRDGTTRRGLQALEQAHAMLQAMAHRDRAHLDQVQETMQGCCRPMVVPLLKDDIHDLSSLEKLRRAMFDPGEEQNRQ